MMGFKLLGFVFISIILENVVNGKCKFPCDWIGKKFLLYMGPQSVVNMVFDEKTPTEVFMGVANDWVYPFIRNPGATMTCVEMVGNNVVLSWTFDGKTYYSCFYFRKISPDVFTVVTRMTFDTSDGYAVNSYKFDEVCLEGGWLYIGKVQGSKDLVDFRNCDDPKSCNALETC